VTVAVVRRLLRRGAGAFFRQVLVQLGVQDALD
jgi:H+/gluconate symporter-like permease